MKIHPAPLVTSIEELKFQFRRIEKYTNEVDVDIVDWKYSPNKTLSVTDALSIDTNLILNFDLMVDNPTRYLDRLTQDKRVSSIILNARSLKNIDSKDLDSLFMNDKQIGISINPENSISEISNYLDKVELLQIYTINPGAQGNPFMSVRLDLVNELRDLGFKGIISIDGGINFETIDIVKSYDIDILSIGTLLCKTNEPELNYARLIEIVNKK